MPGAQRAPTGAAHANLTDMSVELKKKWIPGYDPKDLDSDTMGS